jgi:hypothetical protein
MGATGAAGGGNGGTGGGATGAAGAPNLINFVPQEYQGRDWVKQNMTSPDTFFKFVDNLNVTVGKKGVVIPGEKATPEELSAFRKGIGVPDSPDAYEFENLPELKDAKRNPEAEKVVKAIFHDAGIPKDAAKRLQLGYEKFLYSEQQKILAKNKETDAAFDKATAAIFGDQKDAVLANSKKFLQEHVHKDIAAKLDKLDNDSLLIITSALDGIVKKYVKEDGFKGGASGAGGGASTYEELSKAQRELMKNPAFTNFMHADHQKVMDQNAVLMKKMREIKK